LKNKLLTIALPKGRLGEDSKNLLNKAGLEVEDIQTEGRKLFFDFQEMHYIICRPADVPTYVEYGAADLGIAGKDVLSESGSDVFELLDLKFGSCCFVVAVPVEFKEPALLDFASFLNHKRVATKFPRLTAEFFEKRKINVDIIKLSGNVELAPKAGLASAIVDLVSTGQTLKENELVPIEEVLNSTARLIANRVSYRLNNSEIQAFIKKIKPFL